MIYYYPNRPLLYTPKKDTVDNLENNGYIAELKWNGDNLILDTSTGTIWNRFKKKYNRYRPSPQVLKEAKIFPKDSLINFELMHFHTPDIKDRWIVHCVMAWKGEYLIGESWAKSRQLLAEILPEPSDLQNIKEHVVLSPIYHEGFWDILTQADGKVIEGIVCKDPAGKLVFNTTKSINVPWMIKFRESSITWF